MPEALCSICSGPLFLCGGCPLSAPRGMAAPLADRSFEEKLAPNTRKLRVVIESPFGRNVDGSKCTTEQYARNVRYLERALQDSIRRGDEAPYASHRFFPGLLDDTNPADRALGMQMGLVWSEAAQLVAVYEDHGVTEGIEKALVQHRERGIEVVFRSIGAEPDVAATATGGSLADRLAIRLRSFVRRAAPLLRDGNGNAQLTFMLHQPGGDEDGTLYLEAEIEERLCLDGEEGRVPGVPFDVESAK